MRKRLIWAFVALLASGCSDMSKSVGTSLGLVDDNPLETGRILFDCYRLDTSWGYELDGFYIDSDGAVWRYRREEPWYPAEQMPTVVSERDLFQKFEGAKHVGSVRAEVLTEMVGLIEGASKGRVARETPSFERSGSLDVAYRYDPRQRRYDQVFLGGGGAWVARNFSPEATELLSWLTRVKKEIGYE